MTDSFAIPLLSTQALLMLAALAVLPAALTWAALRLAKHAKAAKWAVILGLLPLPVFALIVWPLLATDARLAADGLAVGGGHYRVTVPYADIDVARIVVGDARAMPPLVTRTNGIGLPGGALGWFRTDDRRVFAAYSGAGGSVLIPTRKDFDVLVSPDDAERLVRELKQRAGATTAPADATEG